MKELPKALIVGKENTLKFLNVFGKNRFRRPLALLAVLEDSGSVLSVTIKCTALLQDLYPQFGK